MRLPQRLVAASTLSIGSPLKGLTMVVIGLGLGTVGTDINTGSYRFNFGTLERADGLHLVPVAMGLFGVAEILSSVGRKHFPTVDPSTISLHSLLPTRQDVRDSIMPTLRGTGVGAIIGALPGSGATIATFMAYALEKRVAKDPSRFGKGAIEGVAAPEAANNAAVQAAFIPTLSLGIPGDAPMTTVNAPVAFVYRRVVDAGGVLVLVAEGIYRGDVVRFDVKLR